MLENLGVDSAEIDGLVERGVVQTISDSLKPERPKRKDGEDREDDESDESDG